MTPSDPRAHRRLQEKYEFETRRMSHEVLFVIGFSQNKEEQIYNILYDRSVDLTLRFFGLSKLYAEFQVMPVFF